MKKLITFILSLSLVVSTQAAAEPRPIVLKRLSGSDLAIFCTYRMYSAGMLLIMVPPKSIEYEESAINYFALSNSWRDALNRPITEKQMHQAISLASAISDEEDGNVRRWCTKVGYNLFNNATSRSQDTIAKRAYQSFNDERLRLLPD